MAVPNAENQPQARAATAPKPPLPKFTSTPAPGYRARYINHNTPMSVSAAQTLNVNLTIQNVGSFAWTQGGPNPFRLGFQWYNAAGQPVQFPPELDFRQPLPHDISPNGSVTLTARLRTPDTPGVYQLRWDMVHEMVTWFVTQGDAGLLVSPITVTPAAATPAPTPAVTPAVPSTSAPAPALAQVQIQDISSQLAQHPSKRYVERPLTAIRRIIVHHTGTPAHITPQRIAEFQVKNKELPGITYHICITADGKAYWTQPPTLMAAHAGQDSRDSLGVCLIGDFTNASPPQPQLEVTASVLAQLAGQLNLTIEQIFGYREITSTQSPGATWPTWKGPLLTGVRSLRGRAASTPAPTPATPATPTAPVSPPAGKPIEHYMLLWHQGSGNWAEWDLRGALDYIGKFPVTIGFSVEEAKLAKNVTIVGGSGGIPDTVDQRLRAAGCKVDRLAGASEAETRKLLNELAKQGKRFRNLQ
jgi:N-acetylmuramoyl-L-alanine amidase